MNSPTAFGSMDSFSPSPSGLTTKDLRSSQEQGAIGLRCWPSFSQSRLVSSNSPMHKHLNGRWSKMLNASTFIPTKRRRVSNSCSTSPAMTLPPWSRSQARAQATSTPVSHSCNSFPKWPRRSHRSASPPATPTLSPVYRRSHRPRPSSSAGVKTGKTRNRTCYPPSTFPLGFRTTSISSLADAPFDREDPTLNPAAGACVTCPRRSGYNTSLFSDVATAISASTETAIKSSSQHHHRPRTRSPSRAYPDRERMEERERAEARSGPARSISRDRDLSREPGRRASPTVCSL